MNASIIIPAWNEEGTIERTLEKLEELNVHQATEVILIAGGTDNTLAICRRWSCRKFAKIRCIQQKSTDGKPGALQKGIHLSVGEYLLLLDADTLVPPDWLNSVTSGLETYVAVSCNYEPIECHPIVSSYQLIRKWASIADGTHGLFGGATIGVRRSEIGTIGINKLFTTETGGGVDTYFERVLREHDMSIGFLKDTTVQTHFPTTIRTFFLNMLRWHSIRFDLEKGDRFGTLHRYGRSLAVSIAPIGILYQNNKNKLWSYLSLSIFFVFLYKTARTVFKASSVTNLAYLFFPQYVITSFLFHLGRVIGYSRRFLGLRKPVHHFKGERES